MSYRAKKLSNLMTLGLALLAGIGLILMMTALAVGAIQGAAANSSIVGGMFAIGVVLLLSGFGGWLAVVRPFEHFDDINVPQYTGHHDEHDTHAIVPAEPHEIVPHAESHS